MSIIVGLESTMQNGSLLGRSRIQTMNEEDIPPSFLSKLGEKGGKKGAPIKWLP